MKIVNKYNTSSSILVYRASQVLPHATPQFGIVEESIAKTLEGGADPDAPLQQ